MAITFDPHQREKENNIPKVTLQRRGSRYVILTSPYGAFYSLSAVVYHNGTKLEFGKDYCFGHTYETGIQRTGRPLAGSVWIFNKKLTGTFTLDAHYVGINIAVESQWVEEVKKYDTVPPIERQYEFLVDSAYFPPVDIQFDWKNWQGELELMEAIKRLTASKDEETGEDGQPTKKNLWVENGLIFDAKAMGTAKHQYVYIDPITVNGAGVELGSYNEKTGRYNGKFVYSPAGYNYTPVVTPVKDYELDFTYYRKGELRPNNRILFEIPLLVLGKETGKGGVITLLANLNTVEIYYTFTAKIGNGGLIYNLLYARHMISLGDFPDCDVYVARRTSDNSLYIKLSRDSRVLLEERFILDGNFFNSMKKEFVNDEQNVGLDSAELERRWATGSHVGLINQTIKTYTGFIGVGYSCLHIGSLADKIAYRECEYLFRKVPQAEFLFPVEVVDIDPRNLVLVGLRKQFSMLNELFKNAPAHQHIPDLNNPHRDHYAHIGAIEKGGVASNSAKVYGKTEAQLTDDVNKASPNQNDLANKIPRDATTSQHITGPVLMGEGLGWIASENNQSLLQLSESGAYIGLTGTGKGSITFNGVSQATIASSKHTLSFNASDDVIRWNGVVLVTEKNITEFIPKGGSGGSGLLYAVSTPTVKLVGGTGSRFNPFVFEWVKPNAANKDVYALRPIANEFGYSKEMLCSPALLAKLEALTGDKLLKSKARFNDQYIRDGVPFDKRAIGLQNVADISDNDLPVSTQQSQLLRGYSAKGHTHDFSFFNIPKAAKTSLGVIKFGGWVADKTLALDGGILLPVATGIEDVHKQLTDVNASGKINIIRYGKESHGEIIDGASINEGMLTIKSATYFVGYQYTTPQKSFNIKELYPTGELEMAICVDLVGEVPEYKLVPYPAVGEDEKRANVSKGFLTEIGTVKISDGLPRDVNVFNVTRLGKFIELTEHESESSPHFRTKYDLSEFTGNLENRIWTEEGFADKPCWRYKLFSEGSPIAYSNGTTFTVDCVSEMENTTKRALTLAAMEGICSDGVVATHDITPLTRSTEPTVESCFLIYKAGAKEHRLSFVISAGAHGVNRMFFAVDYGTNNEQLVAMSSLGMTPNTGGGWGDIRSVGASYTYGDEIAIKIGIGAELSTGTFNLKTGQLDLRGSNGTFQYQFKPEGGALPLFSEGFYTFSGVGVMGYVGMNDRGFTVSGGYTPALKPLYASGHQYLNSLSPYNQRRLAFIPKERAYDSALGIAKSLGGFVPFQTSVTVGRYDDKNSAVLMYRR